MIPVLWSLATREATVVVDTRSSEAIWRKETLPSLSTRPRILLSRLSMPVCPDDCRETAACTLVLSSSWLLFANFVHENSDDAYIFSKRWWGS
jgi:hypothetical protein